MIRVNEAYVKVVEAKEANIVVTFENGSIVKLEAEDELLIYKAADNENPRHIEIYDVEEMALTETGLTQVTMTQWVDVGVFCKSRIYLEKGVNAYLEGGSK